MRLRAIIALAAAGAVGMLFAAGTAQAAAQYPPTVCATLSVSTTHPLPGEAITVSGVNFEPNHAVHLVLRPPSYALGTVNSDAQGSFTTSVKLPDGVYGAHKIVATSGASNSASCPGDPTVTVHIQNPGGTTAGLGGGSGHHGGTSFTGFDGLLVVIAAAVLIVVGAALNRGGKRRHAATRHALID